MMETLKQGDRVCLLGYGSMPSWKLQYVGQTVTVVEQVSKTVQVDCCLNCYWPREAVERVENG